MLSTVQCDVHMRGDEAKCGLLGLGGNALSSVSTGGLEGFEDSSSKAQDEEACTAMTRWRMGREWKRRVCRVEGVTWEYFRVSSKRC